MTEAQQIAAWLRREAEALQRNAARLGKLGIFDGAHSSVERAEVIGMIVASIERGEWKEQDNG